MQSSKRVVINIGAQYIRSVINLCLSLYSTRLVLGALGVSDYGIYTLIAGTVSLLSFIVNAMVVTTQRYMSFYAGKNDVSKLQFVFNTSFFLHVIIGVIAVGIIEIVGLFLFDGFLNIDPSRIEAARSIYHLTTIIILLSFISSPFRALLISHENIVYISIIDIIDGVLKLLIAIVITHSSFDKLVLYVSLLCGIQLFNFIAFYIYDRHKYDECKTIKFKLFQKDYVKELASFAGWTIYSIGCITGRTQGVAIVVNKFFGVVVNAAYGLALQVNGALAFVSQSLLNAMNPQIMKAEGAGNRQRMLRLSEMESKFSFFLLSILVIPCIVEMPHLLNIWLGNVPEYAVYFCRFVLLATLIDQLTIGLGTANQAIGKIKVYSLIVNTTKLLTVVVLVVALLMTDNVYATMWCYVIVEFICAIIRLVYMNITAGVSIRGFVERVFAKEVIPTLCVVGLSCYVASVCNGQFGFVLTFISSIVVAVITIPLFGLCDDEKQIINNLLKKNVL